MSLNSASFATSTREEESRELLLCRKLTWRGGGKGRTACTATGTNICAGNTHQIVKQAEGQENEGSRSIFKARPHYYREAAPLPWKRQECKHDVNPITERITWQQEHWFGWTHTIYCPDTSESVWSSILLGGRLHCGEPKKTC